MLKLYVIKNFVVSILSKVTSLGLGKGQAPVPEKPIKLSPD